MGVHILDAMAREGFEAVQAIHDRRSGLRGFLGIHDSTQGPAFGGIRRWAYLDEDQALRDGLRLARAMTHNCALAGLAAVASRTRLVTQPGASGPCLLSAERAGRNGGRADASPRRAGLEAPHGGRPRPGRDRSRHRASVVRAQRARDGGRDRGRQGEVSRPGAGCRADRSGPRVRRGLRHLRAVAIGEIGAHVGRTFSAILERARSEGAPPARVAYDEAEERIARWRTPA